MKIVPDPNFITQNTADLKAQLEAIPKEALEFEEDVFENDFKLVLNSVKEESCRGNPNRYNCTKCNFRASSKRCLNAHNTFVHENKFYTCEYCPIKTRTEMALHYHIDMKHNTYWELEEQVRDTLMKESSLTGTENREDNTKCDFCEKSFQNNRGLIVHMSRMHKEEYRSKRKETQVVPNECYICGFIFTSEEAFKTHSEKNHNQEYSIQRSDSVT